MKFLRILFILFFASTISLYAQNPNILWQKSYYINEPRDHALEKIIGTGDMGNLQIYIFEWKRIISLIIMSKGYSEVY